MNLTCRMLFLNFKAIFRFLQHSNSADSERRGYCQFSLPNTYLSHLSTPFQPHCWASAQTASFISFFKAFLMWTIFKVFVEYVHPFFKLNKFILKTSLSLFPPFLFGSVHKWN